MELEDRIIISTPEGIELRFALAGAGSRFIAAVVDLSLQVVLVLLAALAAGELVGGGLGVAVIAVASFGAFYLYDILFEVLAAGRTPGKRLTHLRVVREQGSPVDLPASAVRNLLRLIDLLPAAYLVGLTTILLTKRNQRLGDLAAGTLVIRDAVPAGGNKTQAGISPTPRTGATGVHDAGLAGPVDWDVSAVSDEEAAAVRRFLLRRDGLDKRARLELALRLEQGLRAKVAGAPASIDPELFLEALARAKAAR